MIDLKKAVVGIIMGSDSDLEVMSKAMIVLDELEILHEVHFVSAHRTPETMFDYAKKAKERELSILIAGAGGSAHLPGMTASHTLLPVIAVPIWTTAFSGLDSLLSMVQMPAGIPVATMPINGARNAGLFAAHILAIVDSRVYTRLEAFRQNLHDEVRGKDQRLQDVGWEDYLAGMKPKVAG